MEKWNKFYLLELCPCCTLNIWQRYSLQYGQTFVYVTFVLSYQLVIKPTTHCISCDEMRSSGLFIQTSLVCLYKTATAHIKACIDLCIVTCFQGWNQCADGSPYNTYAPMIFHILSPPFTLYDMGRWTKIAVLQSP